MGNAVILEQDEIDALLDEKVQQLDENEVKRKMLFARKLNQSISTLTGERSFTFPSPVSPLRFNEDGDVFIATLENNGCIIIQKSFGARIIDMMLGGDGNNENFSSGDESDAACIKEFVTLWMNFIGVALKKEINTKKVKLYKDKDDKLMLDLSGYSERDIDYFADENIVNFYAENFNILVQFKSLNFKIFVSLSTPLFDYIKHDDLITCLSVVKNNGTTEIVYDEASLHKRKEITRAIVDVVDGLTGVELNNIFISDWYQKTLKNDVEDCFVAYFEPGGEIIIPKSIGLLVAHQSIGRKTKCEHLLPIEDEIECVTEFASNLIYFLNQKHSLFKTTLKLKSVDFYTRSIDSQFIKHPYNYQRKHQNEFEINFAFDVEDDGEVLFTKSTKITISVSDELFQALENDFKIDDLFMGQDLNSSILDFVGSDLNENITSIQDLLEADDFLDEEPKAFYYSDELHQTTSDRGNEITKIKENLIHYLTNANSEISWNFVLKQAIEAKTLDQANKEQQSFFSNLTEEQKRDIEANFNTKVFLKAQQDAINETESLNTVILESEKTK